MEKEKLTKEELMQELEEARKMLEDAKKIDRRVMKGHIKYKSWYGSYPADNFDAIDSHTDVKLYESYVRDIEERLKRI